MPSYRAIVEEREARYAASLLSGHFKPFIYPLDALPGLVLLFAILFLPNLPKSQRRVASVLILLSVILQCVNVAISRRTLTLASGYGIGLICAWGTIMTFSIVVISNPENDFIRLESIGKSPESSLATSYISSGSSSARDVNKFAGSIGDRRTRRGGQGVVKIPLPLDSPKDNTNEDNKLAWQRFPSTVLHRVEWALDLMMAFRGCNWNFRLPSLTVMAAPEPPMDLNISTTFMLEDGGAKSKGPSIASIRWKATRDFAFCYLSVDLLKAIMMTDPYFLGYESLSSPSHWISSLNVPLDSQFSYVATKTVRLVISMFSIVLSLSLVFMLSPLFFTAVPQYWPGIQSLIGTPLSHPGMYPPYWSSPIVALNSTTSSLASVWSKCWHQLFRFGITRPSEKLMRRYQIPARSTPGRLLTLFIGFGLTAFVHTSASYTCFPPNPSNPPRPIRGACFFFVLQPCGILAQTYLNVKILKLQSWPKPLVKLYNTVFLAAWSYFVGPLLADDFARCGIWLFEPVPFSIFRPLLQRGDQTILQWWFWGARKQKWFGWWQGDTWWNSGIAIY